MHAYASAFECEDLALIYPWHDGLLESKETAFALPNAGTLRPVVRVICLDLRDDSFRLIRGESGFGSLISGEYRPALKAS
jgi:5-methylcytosine-specific restriction enzyme subunit McrC